MDVFVSSSLSMKNLLLFLMDRLKLVYHFLVHFLVIIVIIFYWLTLVMKLRRQYLHSWWLKVSCITFKFAFKRHVVASNFFLITLEAVTFLLTLLVLFLRIEGLSSTFALPASGFVHKLGLARPEDVLCGALILHLSTFSVVTVHLVVLLANS